MSASAAQLRNDITMRAAQYAQQNGIAFRHSHFDFGSIVFAPDSDNLRHGNFHPASYRAILRRPIWRKRLNKVLTVTERLKDFEDDRQLCELDSCCSSDALLMNIFCHPRVRSSMQVRAMLGVDERAVPIFGWRARVSLLKDKCDRTEVDMKFGNLLVEAKLTESSFESCALSRMHDYADFREVFCLSALPRSSRQYRYYQLLRNVLAAKTHNASFCLLTDARRVDLIDSWYEVLAAIRPMDLRVRCKLLTFQELSQALPKSLREFLDQKYGIRAIAANSTAVGY
jgi:restriction endonuclease-like protein